MKIKKALIIPDTHVDYHDKRAFRLMLKVARDTGVDHVYLLGDFCDMYNVMSHPRKAILRGLVKREIEGVNTELDAIDEALPKAKKHYIFGNHEDRLERYIDEKCPELYGLVDLPSLLELEERHWSWTDYKPDQLVRVAGSKLFARHEPIGKDALATVKAAGKSIVYGHTHRAEQSQIVHIDGTTHIGLNVGWLGDKKHKAFQYVKGHHQWTLGFGIANILDSGVFYLDQVRIFNYRTVYNGKLYQG